MANGHAQNIPRTPYNAELATGQGKVSEVLSSGCWWQNLVQPAMKEEGTMHQVCSSVPGGTVRRR